MKLWDRNSWTVMTRKWGFKFYDWFVCINLLLSEFKYKYAHCLQWTELCPTPRLPFVSAGNWVGSLHEDMNWKLFELISDPLKWQDSLEAEERFVLHSVSIHKTRLLLTFYTTTQGLPGGCNRLSENLDAFSIKLKCLYIFHVSLH
jgi:hypothetical protein